jgi:hypothetical protein
LRQHIGIAAKLIVRENLNINFTGILLAHFKTMGPDCANAGAPAMTPVADIAPTKVRRLILKSIGLETGLLTVIKVSSINTFL